MDNLTAIRKFAAFQTGYDMDFIRKSFAAKPAYFIEHLETKFANSYDRWGSAGAMVMFWGELDESNREILLEYILNHGSI